MQHCTGIGHLYCMLRATVTEMSKWSTHVVITAKSVNVALVYTTDRQRYSVEYSSPVGIFARGGCKETFYRLNRS